MLTKFDKSTKYNTKQCCQPFTPQTVMQQFNKVFLTDTHINKDRFTIELWLMRHAQSRFNIGIQNERDCDLSDNGILQCGQVNGSYDLVITSNLKRARQTFQNSNIKTKMLMTTDLCREIKHGSICDYLENEEIIIETEDEINIRINKFKQYLLDNIYIHNYNNFIKILIISHACFMCRLTNLPCFGNCQIVKYDLVNNDHELI
jgi:broad specificity phosphatase PhoE